MFKFSVMVLTVHTNWISPSCTEDLMNLQIETACHHRTCSTMVMMVARMLISAVSAGRLTRRRPARAPLHTVKVARRRAHQLPLQVPRRKSDVIRALGTSPAVVVL